MAIQSKFVATALVALAGAGFFCPACSVEAAASEPKPAATSMIVSDTAVVRLRISGMTCGSCPVTARMAINRVAGVYSAKVTIDDSLGVVKYDPQRVTPTQITQQLTRLTGYGAKVVTTPAKPTGPNGR